MLAVELVLALLLQADLMKLLLSRLGSRVWSTCCASYKLCYCAEEIEVFLTSERKRHQKDETQTGWEGMKTTHSPCVWSQGW